MQAHMVRRSNGNIANHLTQQQQQKRLSQKNGIAVKQVSNNSANLEGISLLPNFQNWTFQCIKTMCTFGLYQKHCFRIESFIYFRKFDNLDDFSIQYCLFRFGNLNKIEKWRLYFRIKKNRYKMLIGLDDSRNNVAPFFFSCGRDSERMAKWEKGVAGVEKISMWTR